MNIFYVTRGGRSMGSRGWWSGLLLVLVSLPLTACSPEPSPSPSRSATLRAPSPDASSPDPRAEVQQAVAAYTNLLNAYVSASNSGTADATELAKYASGSALQTLGNGLADNAAKGLKTTGTPGIDPPQVTEVASASDPTTVTTTGCLDDTRWLVYKGDGQPANNSPGGRRRTIARIEKKDGVWLVTGLAIQGVGTCP